MGSRPGMLSTGSAVLGLLVGFSFGWSWGWLTAQLGLTLLLLLWTARDLAPLRLCRAAAAFGAGLGLSGLGELPFSLQPGLQLFSLLPLLLFTVGHALACGLSAALLNLIKPGAGLWRWLLIWPALWMLQEYALSLGRLAMPWLRLGVMQAPSGPFAALLPLGGSLLAGAAMWLLAALLMLTLRRPHSHRKTGAAAAVLLLGFCALTGKLDWTEPQGTLRVHLLQLPAADAATGPAAQGAAVLSQLLEAADRARGELLISPQLALEKTEQALPPGYLALLQTTLDERQSDLLLGMYLDAQAGLGLHNGALALGASGRQQAAKHQLLPFGEFIPLPAGAWRDAVDRLAGQPSQDTVAAPLRADAMTLASQRAAVSFCYELAFSEQWRSAAAEAGLLISLSSDGHHPAAQQRRQFQQIAQARALEYQKPLLRSSDLGGLALDHRAQPLAGEAGRYRLEARHGLTPYARCGDALALLLAGLMLSLALARSREQKISLVRRVLFSVQRGQILMASVGLLLITAGLLYFMVNTGQTVTEKMRVTNAADAAAYSAGVVEARALNVDAYLNRAMVANEIVIAQMVSMASWLRYFASATDNIPGTMGDITYMLQPDFQALQISATFAAAKYGVSYLGMTAEELADYVVDYGIGPIITVHDAIVQTLSLTQSAIQLNLTAGIRQQQIANDLVQQMDPGLKAELILTSHGFDSFTKAYSGQERTRFADVTSRSRDPFTRERNWTIDSADIVVPPIRRDGALKKRGGTELIGFDEWRAVDTLELHGRRFGCGKFGISWCDDIQTPIGWGAVNVNAGGGDAGRGHHGNAYGENGRTAGIADSDMREPLIYNFSGIPTSRDLRDLDAKAERSTRLTMLVSKSQAALMTSGGAAQAKPAGALALFDDKPAGGQLMALARAEVFFDRIAARADGKTEIASLYNPYWRVRLVAPTAGDKLYAATKQGGLALP
ncbi:apolipoprotein N-acyltransferase [Paucibacter sp. DJ1R-11]|uniref:apolipoprotein N-acyltransferase n=1 Tax=Paucibacter sp. DJ1R-11 TaxID=2893556 RepID=UPI0021E4DABD|nr:apolipoprotein N-acyltransferase [Paucibacter sp. DJ1R-11]MCV2365040.1 apolipoprotein N-acyltransferase [Paucibacter sp. DJ1R-11]